ncbi:fimbria/pilus periplasmic chaperone [Halomonas sp. 18H]|uniref:fimbrial biogenesis chaperone n=1 Tax=Halomonas almeriensis TaxID=308163 RepID=UPI002230B0CD|nr:MULTISPECIES: fimbria/pilus periplasmic chaperone [Halomonas]MCW4149776.1 fimbria/pilus periplasmic chaperone [Halomonas sp. 18H]MDN3553263.1 fimbria/pilus periplasmic chaperone [Halomonas almeriensis]
MKRLFVALMTASTLWTGIGMAQASVVIGGTRVVYPSEDREVSVQLQNAGDTPSLVQAWVDSGNPDVSPDESQAPFVIQPPISRIEPDQGQVLRISYTGAANLPNDRESVFWLNVLDVPPNPESMEGEAPQNFLQLAIRSRIKLFYRPEGLEGSARQAAEQVEWTLSGGNVLRAHNTSAYHVTMTQLTLANGINVPISAGEGMLEPNETRTFELPGNAHGSIRELRMTTINDYGARVEQDVTLSR